MRGLRMGNMTNVRSLLVSGVVTGCNLFDLTFWEHHESAARELIRQIELYDGERDAMGMFAGVSHAMCPAVLTEYFGAVSSRSVLTDEFIEHQAANPGTRFPLRKPTDGWKCGERQFPGAAALRKVLMRAKKAVSDHDLKSLDIQELLRAYDCLSSYHDRPWGFKPEVPSTNATHDTSCLWGTAASFLTSPLGYAVDSTRKFALSRIFNDLIFNALFAIDFSPTNAHESDLPENSGGASSSDTEFLQHICGNSDWCGWLTMRPLSHWPVRHPEQLIKESEKKTAHKKTNREVLGRKTRRERVGSRLRSELLSLYAVTNLIMEDREKLMPGGPSLRKALTEADIRLLGGLPTGLGETGFRKRVPLCLLGTPATKARDAKIFQDATLVMPSSADLGEMTGLQANLMSKWLWTPCSCVRPSMCMCLRHLAAGTIGDRDALIPSTLACGTEVYFDSFLGIDSAYVAEKSRTILLYEASEEESFELCELFFHGRTEKHVMVKQPQFRRGLQHTKYSGTFDSPTCIKVATLAAFSKILQQGTQDYRLKCPRRKEGLVTDLAEKHKMNTMLGKNYKVMSREFDVRTAYSDDSTPAFVGNTSFFDYSDM